MARFVNERRRSPGDGLVDRLILAEQETEQLSLDELIANIILLLIAGHETTTNLIGNGLHALLEHPDQLALLRARPELAASAVEECLRYESPTNTNARCPSENIEVSGKVIKAGQLIMCMLGAANRDPEVFADPDRLDITRSPNPHQSFGGGVHHCIGASLARLEGQIALRATLDRYSHIELDRERVRWRDRINLRGFGELGLRVRRRG
jgi:pimeloyl-[acyl-carrier protein] synthase